jgi:NADPH:quinone reductase-like Zn-dependent oxidoreductase
VQLARRAGAEVIGIASRANHAWLAGHGVKPVEYGDGLAERLRETAARIDAFIDTHGDGYVKLALDLGVDAKRIDTIIDFAAAAEYGVKAEGNGAADTIEVVSDLANLVARGELEVPIAATFPLDEVREAFELVEQGHAHGKVVLLP